MRNRVVERPQNTHRVNIFEPKANAGICASRDSPAFALVLAEPEQVLAGSPPSGVRPVPGVALPGIHLQVIGEADTEAERLDQMRDHALYERQHVLRGR